VSLNHAATVIELLQRRMSLSNTRYWLSCSWIFKTELKFWKKYLMRKRQKRGHT